MNRLNIDYDIDHVNDAYQDANKVYDDSNHRDFESMIVPPKEMSSTLHDFYSGKITLGGSTGMPDLDEKIRFKWNEFWFWVGDAGIGKTTTVIFILSMFVKELGIKAILVMKENDYVETREAFVSFWVADNYNMNYDDNIDKIREAEKVFDDHFILLKNDKVRTFEDDIAPFYEYIKKKGMDIDLIVTDPISGMGAPSRLRGVSGDSLHTFLSEYYRDWAVGNCSIWAISHTTVGKQREQNYPIPQNGLHGGRYNNAAHSSITLYRNLKGGDDGDKYKTELRIFKQRSKRMKGGDVAIDPPIELHYRFSPFGFDIVVDDKRIGNPFVQGNGHANIDNKDIEQVSCNFYEKDDMPF